MNIATVVHDQRTNEKNQRQHVFSNKGRKLPPEPLAQDEVRAVLSQCNPRYFTGIRDLTIILLMWRAQLRISEVLALRSEDLDFEQCAARVLHGKGDKTRLIGFDSKTAEALQRWLERRKQRGFCENELLFCTTTGRKILPGHFRNKIKRLARRASLKKRAHCHGFRHTGATELLREGVNLRIIQAQLGHSNIATTHAYLRYLCPQEVLNTMRNRIW